MLKRKLSRLEEVLWVNAYMKMLEEKSVSEAIKAADKSISRLRSFAAWSAYDITGEDDDDKYPCDVEW